MKICFLSSARYAYPLDETTEKKFRVLSEIGELYAIGFSDSFHFRRFTEYAHITALPELSLPLLRYLLFFLVTPLLCLWNIFHHRINIVVAQGPYEGAVAAVAKILAGWGGQRIALIIENHGDFEESLFMQRRVYFRRFYKLLMRMFAKFAFSHADFFRAVSDSTRQQLEQWQVKGHIFQFVAWTDIEPFIKIGESRRNVFSPIILYAGVLIPRKGIIHLIHAFANLANDFPHILLRIVGKEDNSEYADTLRTSVADLKLEQRVTFIDAVPQRVLARFMEETGIFVLPSYSEGLPRVIFEAMAAGLPIIATHISGIPEVVQDGKIGFLVPPGDEIALTEKIRWMLEHHSETVEMGRQAYLAANAVFSTEMWLNAYRQMFNSAQACLQGVRE